MIRISARSVRTLVAAVLVTGLIGLSSCGKSDNSGDAGNKPDVVTGTLLSGDQVTQLMTRNAWCTTKSNATLSITLTARFSPDATFTIETQKCETHGAMGNCTELPLKSGTWNVGGDGYLNTILGNQTDRAKVYLLSAPGEFKKVRVKGDGSDFTDFSEC